MNHVIFDKYSDDGLTGVRWGFYLLRNKLVVDSYEEMERQSKRHKPKVVRAWWRLSPRDSTIKKDAVPFTTEVAQEAKAAFIEAIESQVTVGFQA